ncbi:MAG: AraC family transcriptional regulator [Holophagaceae bacterium]|nr:AraC family transcriptional regulator [Holophagaceae bacterium]
MAASSLNQEQHHILRQLMGDIQAVLEEEGQGRRFSPLLAEVGLASEDLVQGAPGLTFGNYSKAMLRLCEDTQIPGLGIRLAMRKRPGSLGVFGLGMATSTSLAHSLRFAPWFMDLIWNQNLHFSLKLEPGWIVLCFRMSWSREAPCAQVLMEEAFMTSIRVIAEIQPQIDWSVGEIRMRSRGPSNAELYRTQFPCSCRFGQAEDELRIPSVWLTRPLALANPSVNAYCESLCGEMVGRQTHGRALQYRVEAFLVRHGRDTPTALRDVATSMGMTERALRGGLAREGTSFREILHLHRVKEARKYLEETGIPIKEIAYRVGFAQLPSFYRAFGKELGLTPEHYRALYVTEANGKGCEANLSQ